MDYLIIGDVHGSYDKLEKLVSTVHQGEQLVFLGDYIDRGKDSRKVLEFIQQKQLEGAILLRGNHEQMFLDFLNKPEEDNMYYLGQGGIQTFESFGLMGFDAEYLAEQFKQRHSDLYELIKATEYYFETDDYIFVHAGISPFEDDWKNTPEEDFLWIREWFHRTPNITEKTVVFGHTPTFFLHGEQTNEVWDSRSTGKIGIDGAAFSEGGLLHAIKVKNGRKSFRNYFVDDELNFHARVYI